MAKIIVQADQADDRPHVTLAERIVAARLDYRHYAGRPIERLSWAVDAEALELASRRRLPGLS